MHVPLDGRDLYLVVQPQFQLVTTLLKRPVVVILASALAGALSFLLMKGIATLVTDHQTVQQLLQIEIARQQQLKGVAGGS